MSWLDEGATFTLAANPTPGGRYIVFSPSERGGNRSPYDRTQFFTFVKPPYGFDEDPMFGERAGWTLNGVDIIDVFHDHPDDMPIFTIVEKRGKFCRVEQVGGTRKVDRLRGKWLSIESIAGAISYGVLELLS